jgi:hypothetical protein
MNLNKYTVLKSKMTRRAIMKNDSYPIKKQYYSKVSTLTNTKQLQMQGMSASAQRDAGKDSKMNRIYF